MTDRIDLIYDRKDEGTVIKALGSMGLKGHGTKYSSASFTANLDWDKITPIIRTVQVRAKHPKEYAKALLKKLQTENMTVYVPYAKDEFVQNLDQIEKLIMGYQNFRRFVHDDKRIYSNSTLQIVIWEHKEKVWMVIRTATHHAAESFMSALHKYVKSKNHENLNGWDLFN